VCTTAVKAFSSARSVSVRAEYTSRLDRNTTKTVGTRTNFVDGDVGQGGEPFAQSIDLRVHSTFDLKSIHTIGSGHAEPT
jgi:hypothetical protein